MARMKGMTKPRMNTAKKGRKAKNKSNKQWYGPRPLKMGRGRKSR